jgi:hypothetical protein
MNGYIFIMDSLNHIDSFEKFLESRQFTQDQITESLRILESGNFDDPLLEHWWNTVFDFAALIPGVGSIFEGINLVSYAKQGEYLLAGLCAIGLIPIFGQYIGSGGSLLVKAFKGGGKIGMKVLGPLGDLIAKYLPKIAAFFKSEKFLTKFKGIAPYTEKMLVSLKEYATTGKTAGKLGEVLAKKSLRRYKTLTKVGEWLVPRSKETKAAVSTYNQINPAIAETGESDWSDFLKGVPTY